MARAANISPAAANDDDDIRPVRQRVSQAPGSLSPSPTASFSSDKENREAAVRQGNGKSKAMPPPKLPTPALGDGETPRTNRKRKLAERDAPTASQIAHARELDEVGDTQYYDPDQSMDERRAIRKGFRDLSRELTDSRAEYLSATSTRLKETLEKANGLFETVKQTSDATLDSRLLVSTADLSLKRTAQLSLGDTAPGIDISEFVSKCKTFMRRGPSNNEQGSARRRRANHGDDEGSGGEDAADEGDAYNWDWLGRQACFPFNVRPPVPGFLLGPLSVQKKIRKQTQRRERLQRRDPADAVRPEELKVQDIEKVENANLTTICRNIFDLLQRTQNDALQHVEQEIPDPNSLSTEEIASIMDSNGMSDDGGIPLLSFVINPRSFGQTVENLFYVSFLIRDGMVGLGGDSHTLPTLHVAHVRKPGEEAEKGVHKKQAVFHLDFETWEDIVEAFGMRECVIPHRVEDEAPVVSASGWYA